MADAGKTDGDTSANLSAEARERLLRLVTRSFCREVVDYGVDLRDLVKVSGHVLEYASGDAELPSPGSGTAFERLALDDVVKDRGSYSTGAATVRPFSEADLPSVVDWVARDDIRDSMLMPYPSGADALGAYLADDTRAYHIILHDGRPAGLIGGENLDPLSSRVEMRKFIGEPDLRGRGVGTVATFLWLHHVFDVLEINKVYIHTHNANARNIRVNRSLGFEVEGVLSEEHMLDGRFVDIIRMGLLRRTWHELTL